MKRKILRKFLSWLYDGHDVYDAEILIDRFLEENDEEDE